VCKRLINDSIFLKQHIVVWEEILVIRRSSTGIKTLGSGSVWQGIVNRNMLCMNHTGCEETWIAWRTVTRNRLQVNGSGLEETYSMENCD
jgi:hypothetical protein